MLQKIYSVKTKGTVSIRSLMRCWCLLKTGHCVWFEVVSIFPSLVKWHRSLSRWSGAGMFVVMFVEGIARFLLGKTSRTSVRPFRLLNCVLR